MCPADTEGEPGARRAGPAADCGHGAAGDGSPRDGSACCPSGLPQATAGRGEHRVRHRAPDEHSPAAAAQSLLRTGPMFVSHRVAAASCRQASPSPSTRARTSAGRSTRRRSTQSSSDTRPPRPRQSRRRTRTTGSASLAPMTNRELHQGAEPRCRPGAIGKQAGRDAEESTRAVVPAVDGSGRPRCGVRVSTRPRRVPQPYGRALFCGAGNDLRQRRKPSSRASRSTWSAHFVGIPRARSHYRPCGPRDRRPPAPCPGAGRWPGAIGV